MECKRLCKSRPLISVSDFSAKLSQILNAERHEKRRELFWGSRVVFNESAKCKPAEKKKNPRAEMLQKWKAEKMKRLEEEKKKQKPVFKVGIVQRKITGSPLIKQKKPYTKKDFAVQPAKTEPNYNEFKKPGVLTRAKAKQMAGKSKFAELRPVIKTQVFHNKCCKIEGGKKMPIDSHEFKVPEAVLKFTCSSLTFPCSPKLMRRSRKSVKLDGEVNVKTEIKEQVDLKATELKVELIEPEEEVKDIQENILQPLKVTLEKAGLDVDDYRPIHYSPFVTVRSGKKSKKKLKKSLNINIDEEIKKEENEFKCRIFSFRKYIDCETKRLSEICNKWKNIHQEFQDVPVDVEGDIDSAVGKTNLLTSDKFMQFKGLIDKCENGDSFISVHDLQGFQDWISIEVEKLNEEFHKLEKLKCNNWKREMAPIDISKVRKVKVVKNLVKKPVGRSNIRSHILAARKLLKEKNDDDTGEASKLPILAFEVALKATTPKEKRNFLKEGLNSELKENRSSTKKLSVVREQWNSGLEIMIASQKNKFPTPTKLQKSPFLNNYEILVGKQETPNKSILKKTPKTLSSSKGHVTFENQAKNLTKLGRGLSEKYFQPLTDDEASPPCMILGDLSNLVLTGMNTRSKTRQMSYSTLRSPQVN